MGIIDVFRVSKIKEENSWLKEENERLLQRINELGVTEYEQTKLKIEELEEQSALTLNKLNSEIVSNNNLVAKLRTEIQELQERNDKLTKSVSTQEKKIARCKEMLAVLLNKVDTLIF